MRKRDLFFKAYFLIGLLCLAYSRPCNAQNLEEIRLTMDKWIETQQIISKERKDWQQGKDILLGRLELVKSEIGTLEEKIKQAEASVGETNKKRDELLGENDQLKSTSTQLTDAASKIDADIHLLFKQLPDPIQTRLQPLYQRIPTDQTTTRVSAAERYQNILGILNELNKINNEITVNYEVRTLANGKPSEVKAAYVGLAQGYYVSTNGEAGIGRPNSEGWIWEASEDTAGEILTVLDILEGKQSPAFIPLPVKIQ